MCLPMALGLPNFKGSEDFGTSPFYGQLPGQASSSLPIVLTWARGTLNTRVRLSYISDQKTEINANSVVGRSQTFVRCEQFYTDSPPA